ncbi:hypothetical protein BC834DRAFT_314573 [Gloeopeniophorella convolvens]|nr:hypothetical protein BC834DRAFT_314573 [Gloeopeniophorella convolvens]
MRLFHALIPHYVLSASHLYITLYAFFTLTYTSALVGTQICPWPTLLARYSSFDSQMTVLRFSNGHRRSLSLSRVVISHGKWRAIFSKRVTARGSRCAHQWHTALQKHKSEFYEDCPVLCVHGKSTIGVCGTLRVGSFLIKRPYTLPAAASGNP